MAQVREWIRGWAGEVTGEMEVRVLGSVWLLGKRMGEVNGLEQSVRAPGKSGVYTYG